MKQHFTANEITAYCMKVLPLKYKAEVWRQNQIPQRGRTFKGRRGVGDITGYINGTGQRLEVEVKAKGDKLSEEQIEFLRLACDAGCLCLVAHEEAGEIVLTQIFDYLQKKAA